MEDLGYSLDQSEYDFIAYHINNNEENYFSKPVDKNVNLLMMDNLKEIDLE